MLQRTRRLSANGLTHAVHDSGAPDAPAAILLHGFPDSSAVWARSTPALVEAGFRVLAPDLRGFGETDMAPGVADYEIERGAAPDIIGILDALGVEKAHLVGHDFGAPVAWALAATSPSRFASLTALSVGHPMAYLESGFEQKLRSLYVVYHQLRGVCEATYRAGNWALLRSQWSAHGDVDEAIRLLSRPGRLTAGLNWYRANLPLSRLLSGRALLAGAGRVSIPTLGVWSTKERYLVEAQMTGSARYVDSRWTYAKIEGASHWIPYDAPQELAALLIRHWRAG